MTIGAIEDSSARCKYVKHSISNMWTSSTKSTPGTNSAMPWSMYLFTTLLISPRSLSKGKIKCYHIKFLFLYESTKMIYNEGNPLCTIIFIFYYEWIKWPTWTESQMHIPKEASNQISLLFKWKKLIVVFWNYRPKSISTQSFLTKNNHSDDASFPTSRI